MSSDIYLLKERSPAKKKRGGGQQLLQYRANFPSALSPPFVEWREKKSNSQTAEDILSAPKTQFFSLNIILDW